MADDQQYNQTGGSTGAAVLVADSGVKVDKNKTAEQYIIDVEALYIVPPLIREKFSDLVKLIYETESMDSEEREYWLQIMPIMSEDQVVKLRDILVNEKEQLAKLDKDYSGNKSPMNTTVVDIDEVALKEKMAQIKSAELQSEKKEQDEEAELLKKLSEM